MREDTAISAALRLKSDTRPTYYGIDMWALSLWSKYAPSNSSLAKYGPLMLSGLWDTMGGMLFRVLICFMVSNQLNLEYYNANLKNFAGPYDRTYGNGRSFALPFKYLD